MAANWLIYSFTIESPTVSRQTATYVIAESVSTVRGLLDGASVLVQSTCSVHPVCIPPCTHIYHFYWATKGRISAHQGPIAIKAVHYN